MHLITPRTTSRATTTTTTTMLCLCSLSIFFIQFPAITYCDNHINNNSRPSNNNNSNNNNYNNNNDNQNFLVALYSVAAATEGGKDNKSNNNVGLLPTFQLQEQIQQQPVQQQQQQLPRRSANGNTMAFATANISRKQQYSRSSHTPPPRRASDSTLSMHKRSDDDDDDVHHHDDEEEIEKLPQTQQQQQLHHNNHRHDHHDDDHLEQRTKRDTATNNNEQHGGMVIADGGGGDGGGDSGERNVWRSARSAMNIRYVDDQQQHQQQQQQQQEQHADLALHLKYKEQKFYNTTNGGRGMHGSGGGGGGGGDGGVGNGWAPAAHTTTTPELSSSNLVSGDAQHERLDICKYCKCENKTSAFTHVFCDFTKNRELSSRFNRRLAVPHNAIALAIQLSADTQFRLSNGFFYNNKVNSLRIIGSGGGGDGDEQVEIETNAFEGNTETNLEMHFENIHTVFVNTRSFSGTGILTMQNCFMVKLWPNAFHNASIRASFTNIRDLSMEERAFNNGQTKLKIMSSKIDNLYRFEASLSEVQFINCTLGTINTGTFDVHSIHLIVFDNCTINTIKVGAISSKLMSEHVQITHGIIGYIESQAINCSGIQELILTDNDVDTIQSNAIHVYSVNVTISGNNIRRLERDWLLVDEWTSIKIEKNRFGDFGHMLLAEAKHPNSCTFSDNHISKPQPDSLNIANGHCIVREAVLDKPCRCNTNWLEEFTKHDLVAETYCTLDAKLAYCFDMKIFNYLKYMNEVCDVKKTTLKCRTDDVSLKKIDGDFYTPEELENKMSSWNITTLALIIVSAVVIVAMFIAVVIYCVQLRKRHADNPSHINRHAHVFTVNDRETIDKAARIVETKYPDFYKDFNSCRTQLYRTRSEEKCLQIISRFTDLMRDIGDDSRFKDFNDLLVKHVQPPTPTAPSEIYAEPSGGRNNFDACYASSSIYPISVGAYERENNINNLSGTSLGSNENNEPIYAEPNCPQEPLLSNEYCLPADRNMNDIDAAAYAYSEPINSRQVPKMNIPPPEYAQPHRHHNKNIALAKKEFLAK